MNDPIKTIPQNHELRLSRYGESFDVTLHDNGDCKIKRAGFRGAEYYERCNLLKRIKVFSDFGYRIGITLYFTANDLKNGFYHPDKNQKEIWTEKLKEIGDFAIGFSIAHVKFDGGIVHLSDFYFEREEGLVGFTPGSERTEKTKIPLELSLGFDSLANTSLYKS